MPDPLVERDMVSRLLAAVAEKAVTYLETVDQRPAGGTRLDEVERSFDGDLPERGDGGLATLTALMSNGLEGAVNSAGPRFFHFVTGGSTPAALAADWLASALDNNAGLWVSSPLASRLEQLSLRWLKELFGLPSEWAGVTTTGATMSNFTALAAARQWWGEEHGQDIAARGMSSLPPVPVF
ncbi:MAG TPA: pyridoxal-dependent decarboxylase, partial [Candidatus Dormibacteraeota bacterium]